MKLDKFFLRDVRCFKGEKEFDISPLTFLVGENSTGKSTVLGCIQALIKSVDKDRYLGIMEPIDFNSEPFQMGAFENIVRKALRTQSLSWVLNFMMIQTCHNFLSYEPQ